jgi:MioC protein
MSEKILIIVATMGGTAELVAEEVANRIEEAGGKSSIRRMEKVNASQLVGVRALIVCSSTYGTGDVPDNGKALYEQLQTDRPDLTGLRYGVVALGDSVYPQTFCFGGKKFDELLRSLGAKRIGERAQHDARGAEYPEDVAGAWAEAWYPLLESEEANA